MGRYRSVQSTLIESALKGITDNQTVTAYKKDCKLFAAFCKEQGVKRPDQLQGREKELLQAYEKELEAAGYNLYEIYSIIQGSAEIEKLKAELQDNYIIELYIDLCYITGRCVGNHAPLLYTTI